MIIIIFHVNRGAEITLVLINREHKVQIDIVFRQLFTQINFHIVTQRSFARHHQRRKITRIFLLLSAVHHQRPVLVVRVNHIRVVDSFVWPAMGGERERRKVKNEITSNYSSSKRKSRAQEISWIQSKTFVSTLTEIFRVNPMRQMFEIQNCPCDVSVQEIVVAIINVGICKVHCYLKLEHDERARERDREKWINQSRASVWRVRGAAKKKENKKVSLERNFCA
jgi:hypothetical protein